jgi:hypothetical protein
MQQILYSLKESPARHPLQVCKKIFWGMIMQSQYRLDDEHPKIVLQPAIAELRHRIRATRPGSHYLDMRCIPHSPARATVQLLQDRK